MRAEAEGIRSERKSIVQRDRQTHSTIRSTRPKLVILGIENGEHSRPRHCSEQD